MSTESSLPEGLFRFGRRCPLLRDPGEYLYTTIEYAAGEKNPHELGAVAHFEGRRFGEYLPPGEWGPAR